MTAPREVLVLAVLGAALFAGCTGPEARDGGTAAPIVVTAPDDYSYLNGTDGTRPHLHDYWFGADTRLVLDETVSDVGPGVAGGQVVIHRFEAPSGSVVPLGTAFVEITIDWTDAPGDMYAQPQLWLETSADHEPWLVADVAPGDVVRVESNNSANDLPHQLLSAWAFEFRLSAPAPPEPFLRFKGEVSMLVIAHRGLEIPLFPAHPDHWQGEQALPLFEASHTVAYAHDPGDGGCDGISCQEVHTPDDGHLVPQDAAVVVVELSQTNRDLFPLGLAYHSARSRVFERAEPTEADATGALYHLAVEGFGDGPYARQSQWAFQVVIDGPVMDGATYAEYTLVAQVLRGPA